MTPGDLNEWLARVVAPIAGIAWASWLIATRQPIEPYDVTLVVALLGMRLIGRQPPP